MISKVAVTLSLLSITSAGFVYGKNNPVLISEKFDGDSIRDVLITDVIISANKERGKLSQLPISASVMKSTEIKNRNITNIKDFSLMIPNLFMPDYGTKLTSPIYIRGIGSRINSPSVGLYVDGIPYFEKSTFDFDFSDVSMIEVLRGPQGTLYGRNTMGGIINVTTHSPLSYEGTHINLSTGNYDRLQGTVSHYQKINDHWGFSVTGNYIHNGGYFYNVTTDSKADKMNSGGGRIRLRYNKDRWDVNIISNYEYSDQSGYPYMLVDTLTKKTTVVNYNDPSFFRRELSSNGVIANFIHDKFIFTSRTSYQYFKGHQGIDQDFSPINKYYINQHEKQNMVSQELEFKNSKNEVIDWIGGIFGFYQGMDKQVAMQYKQEAKPTNMLSDKFYDNPSYGVSFFTHATAPNLFIKNLAFTLGARYDIEYSDMHYKYYTVTEAKGRVLQDEFKHHLKHGQFSPKASLQYSFKGNKRIYATVTKGYKAGGFNTSFVTDEERTFRPEHSWNYEVGTKLSFADGRFNTDIALFYIDWSDQQVYQPLSTGRGSLLKNAGKSSSKGIEWSSNWQIAPGLNLQTSYGYTHATFKEYTDGKTDFKGNYLPYVPKNSVAANINYAIYPKKESLFSRINLSLQYNGIGSLYWNDKNTMKQDFYNTVSARAAFSIQRFTTALWMKNIMDTDYAAFYFEALGNSYIQKARPRTFGVDLTYSF